MNNGKSTSNTAKTLHVFLLLKRKITVQCLGLHSSSALKELIPVEDSI